MSQVFKQKKDVPLDIDKYVNDGTGELLSSEISSNKLSVKASKETGMCIITSENYAVIETNAFLTLTKILNNSDLANVVKMSVLTKTPLNIIFNNNIPHTNESLQKYLEVGSEAMFMKLLKRLINAGILYQIKGKIYGEVRVCYMLNPFLSRKRKSFEDKVFEVFDKFTLLDVKKEKGISPNLDF